MVCFMIADMTLVGNVVENKGSKTVVKVGSVFYTVPTNKLRLFNRK